MGGVPTMGAYHGSSHEKFSAKNKIRTNAKKSIVELINFGLQNIFK